MKTIEMICKIIKKDIEKRIAFSVVYEPDLIDSDDEYAKAEEIEKTAHGFMTYYRNVKKEHEELINHAAQIVESYIAPIDMVVNGERIKKGSWVVGIHISDDELWEEVKAGEITGVSMGGFALSEN